MLKIAYGKSCESKVWSNGNIDWPELCAKMKNTVRTKETVAEYQSMTKAERTKAKDRGGFVGGFLLCGIRIPLLSQGVNALKRLF